MQFLQDFYKRAEMWKKATVKENDQWAQEFAIICHLNLAYGAHSARAELFKVLQAQNIDGDLSQAALNLLEVCSYLPPRTFLCQSSWIGCLLNTTSHDNCLALVPD